MRPDQSARNRGNAGDRGRIPLPPPVAISSAAAEIQVCDRSAYAFIEDDQALAFGFGPQLIRQFPDAEELIKKGLGDRLL
jgi:hypothetical protein